MSVVAITNEQNIICSKTHLHDITYEKIIILGHLFVGHVIGSRPMKRKKILHQIIICKMISFIYMAIRETTVLTVIMLPRLLK